MSQSSNRLTSDLLHPLLNTSWRFYTLVVLLASVRDKSSNRSAIAYPFQGIRAAAGGARRQTLRRTGGRKVEAADALAIGESVGLGVLTMRA